MNKKTAYYKEENREKLLSIYKEHFSHTKNFKVILVGGTNGKGSTSTFLQHHLSKSKVGLFTSPHLMYTNERIRVNNDLITSSEIGVICKKYLDVFIENELSFYEIMLFIALEHFSNKKIEYAILEIGVGGEFDACNIVEPYYSVLTSISIDHKNMLGKTIGKIVKTKVKIGRKYKPLFVNENETAIIKKLIQQNSLENESRLIEIKTEKYKKILKTLPTYNEQFKTWPKHLIDNLSYSIGIAERIGVSLEDIKLNIKKIRKPFARMSHVKYEGRNLLIDGCHNYKSVRGMIKNLDKNKKYDVIFVSKRGKPYLKELLLIMSAKEIRNISLSNFGRGFINWTRAVLPLNKKSTNFLSVYSDWKLALEATLKSDKDVDIIICGSLYFAGSVQRELDLQEENDISPKEMKAKFLK